MLDRGYLWRKRIWRKPQTRDNVSMRIYVAICTCGIMLMQTVPAMADADGWARDDVGSRYQKEDASYASNEWVLSEGNWYHVDSNGYMQTGWFQNGPMMYWLGEDGVMLADTRVMIDGKVYIIESDGACYPQSSYQGWIQDGKGWWYHKLDGSYWTASWQWIDGEWYRFDDEGYMQTGWFHENGISYWLGQNGVMAHDETVGIQGMEYYFDSSGASAMKFKEPTRIPGEEEKSALLLETDQLADQILAGIIHEGMSKREKAVAIYQWVRGNLRYTYQPNNSDWVLAAHEGLKKRRGECYTFYSVSLELLSRVGIESIEVIRSRDNNHWWNLVHVEEGWFHFDTTPRSDNKEFCLMTDRQLLEFSDAHGRSHMFERSLYPPTP